MVALCLSPGIASAKIPYFGLEVTPFRPSVREPITLTMRCFSDEGHTQPWTSCMGAGGIMAWVHPLDEQGELDRSDWIPVEGHETSTGATRGRITLTEPGPYDVLPLWRRWSDHHGAGFPDPIRIDVTQGRRIIPMALAVFGVAGTCLAVVARRRRTALSSVTQ